MDTLPLDSDTSRWPQLHSSTRIQPTSSGNITDAPDTEMKKDITPLVLETPVIDWGRSIQNGFRFSSTYESMNEREYSNNGAEASASSEHRSDQMNESVGH